jgi:hypothetical protein
MIWRQMHGNCAHHCRRYWSSFIHLASPLERYSGISCPVFEVSLIHEVSLPPFCLRPFSAQSFDWNVVIHSRFVHESVGLSVFQYRRNLHWSKEKLEQLPSSHLPKNDVCSFLRSTKDFPLYCVLCSPKTRFLHLFLSLVSSSGCPCLAVLRLTPSIFLWVLPSFVFPLVSILRFSVVFVHYTKI